MNNRHPTFIRMLLEHLECKSYLELGLGKGETFVLACEVTPHCVGVDVNLRFKTKKGIIHKMTTDQFFLGNKETFDLIFIDADHSFEQVKVDFASAIEILNSNGFIVLHDTDPVEKRMLNFGYAGDCYKIIDYIRSLGQYDILTLPISKPGLSIVTRKNNRRVPLGDE